MKTTTFQQGFRALCLCSSLVLVGCQKEEFFEKEYLENPFRPEAELEGGVNGGETAGSATGGATDGSATGGTTNGSATGGSSNGSATGGATDGSATGGSSNGSATGGATDGSVNGGTTGGDTTGGTSGGTSGGSDPCVSNPATTGGFNGGNMGNGVGNTGPGNQGNDSSNGNAGGCTTTGSVNGGSTGGTTGDTSGGSNGGTSGGNPGVTYQWAEESFTQNSEEARKLDILWVIDNSGSMGDEQASLASNFGSFIDEFLTRNVDFKMAITTTDTTNQNGGWAVGDSLTALTAGAARVDEARFVADFQRLIQVGVRGSGHERGLQASESFLNRYQANWMRPDAYFVVVYVSDEEDQSPKSVQEYLARLQGAKDNLGAGYVKAFSIVNTAPCQAVYGITCGYQRYAFQSEQTNGAVADINQNFASVLRDMSETILNLLDTFPLSQAPLLGSAEVYVNGVRILSGWSIENQQLKFEASAVPAVGSEVRVRYQHQ